MTKRRRLRIVIAYRSARSRLSRFLTGSLAIHGLLFTALIVIPATRRHPMPIEDSMVVALAGPIAESVAPRGGSTMPQTAPAVKPKDVPPPAPKEAHTVREVPAPKPKDKPKKLTKPEPEAPSKESPTGPQPTTPSPAKGTGEPGKPEPGGGAVTATIGTGDASLNWYGAAVKAALESAWAKPFLEDATGTASVVIGFDIERNGTTKNLRVIQSSGIPTLDRSAQRAVIEASPLPAIPPSFSDNTIPVTMRFDLTPDNH
jgi:TonB family protein